MRLKAPTVVPDINLKDTNGEAIDVANGQRTYLAFFRDASCPFCNMHIYRITQYFPEWKAKGLNMVAVFNSSPEAVEKFIMIRPRPFAVAAEPEGESYEIFGLKKSFAGKLKAIIRRFWTLLQGLRFVGLHGFVANNMMPADFLIDETGHIVEAYYGKDAGDHIPFERIELFLSRGAMKREAAAS